MTETELIDAIFEACKRDVQKGEFNPQIALICRGINGDIVPLPMPQKILNSLENAPANVIKTAVSVTWQVGRQMYQMSELLCVLFISDTWFSTYTTDEFPDFEAVRAAREAGKIPMPSKDPKRQEAFLMIEHRKDGQKTRMLFYDRKDGKIEFRQPDEAVAKMAGGRFGQNLFPNT